MEYDKGDVSLWLNILQVYRWNKEAVEATKAKLETIYAQRDDVTVDRYLEGYAGRIGSVLPQFPDMTGYPGVLPP